VVSYAASQRTTEVGVRLALGATPRRVIAQMLNETMRVIAAGAGVGWLGAWWITGRFDVPVFATVPALLLLVAAIACWLPARRATRIDPLRALRQE
jgi:ABC-type antimicrobial peptide transport system permease subunit